MYPSGPPPGNYPPGPPANYPPGLPQGHFPPGQQPGGYPLGGPPPFNRVGGSVAKKARSVWSTIKLVVSIAAVLGAIGGGWWYWTHKVQPQAEQTKIATGSKPGDCIKITGTTTDPKLEKLACDNPAATHIVGKSMGATSQKCGDSYDEYVETVEYDNSGTQRTTAKLCLVPNLAEGICIRGDAAADTAASDEKVDCRTPSAIKVAKAVKGKADKTLCPPKTDASVYPEPPTTLCFGNP